MTIVDAQQVQKPDRRASHLFAHPLAAPLAVGIAAVSALALVSARNPHVQGSFFVCPFHAATGLDCPGCGATRGLYELVHGNLVAMADCNLLLALALPFLALRYVQWTGVRAGRFRPRMTLAKPRWIIAFGIVVIAFWVVRNLPGVPFLSAGIG